MGVKRSSLIHTLENAQLAEWLLDLRRRVRLSQRKFYAPLGVTQQSGNNYELGKSHIPGFIVLRAMRAYGNHAIEREWTALGDRRGTLGDRRSTKDRPHDGGRTSPEAIAEGAISPQGIAMLGPVRSDQLRSFMLDIARLFVLGTPNDINMLKDWVNVINEYAKNRTTHVVAADTGQGSLRAGGEGGTAGRRQRTVRNLGRRNDRGDGSPPGA